MSMDLRYKEVKAMTEEISSVAHRIAAHVACRRNALTKINSLPNKILSRISMETSLGDAVKSKPLSQTCSHWRDISIKCASLWSQIAPSVFQSTYTIDLFLKRTQGYPISVKLMPCAPTIILTLLSQHISHICILDVGGAIYKSGLDQ